ncbi:hypothetical protein [Streptomyces sp. NPDC006739]|uniref:hypothetical protein n=1 Tax=Streptomyces sp. NPDC006739 TaxID=3364763 RepID=UPI0036B66640
MPDGLPAGLRDFPESARKLPHWTDPTALARGQRFVRANAQQIAFSEVLDVTPVRVTPVRMKYPAEARPGPPLRGKAAGPDSATLPHDRPRRTAFAISGRSRAAG